jgi:hypothetical protein
VSTVHVYNHELVKSSNALNLEEGEVMNMKIYIGSGHQSIISYVQYESTFPLLIFEGSGTELITGENTSLGVL